ncbi:hypothetical protein TNCV_1796411 [Trichonephila clavipes]|nr:hypothetical protein TNCV_1796411 [Trichonephila clavipes]
MSASKLALSMSSTIGENISDETIRCNLHQYGFHSRTPIRKPLIYDGRFKIWREAGKALAPKNTIKRVKFGDGSVLVLGCMLAGGVGEFAFIDAGQQPQAYSEDCAVILAVPFQEAITHSRPKRHRKFVHEHEITSKEVLKKVLREEWPKLSVEITETLVESMPRRLKAVNSKKYATVIRFKRYSLEFWWQRFGIKPVSHSGPVRGEILGFYGGHATQGEKERPALSNEDQTSFYSVYGHISEGKAIFGGRAAIELHFGEKERPAQRRSN